MSEESHAVSPAFAVVVRTSGVGAGVVEGLKDMIASGDLRAGDRLPSQRALSESMGVSLPTVREAIRSLTNMGLLEARHGSGTYVTALQASDLMGPMRFALSLSDRSMAELFDVRLMLEPAAARAAAERRSDQQVAAMRTCLRASKADGMSSAKLLELDLELHGLVVQASNNSLLVELMGAVAMLGVESRERTVDLPGMKPATISEHEAIVQAIYARRATAAERAMCAHIARVRDMAAASGLPARIDDARP